MKIETYKNTLVYGFDNPRDCLLITPFLYSLRNKCPQARITVLVGIGAGEALENNPDIDEIIQIENNSKLRREYITSKKFTASFVLNTSFSSAFQVFRSRIPFRIGHNKELRCILLNKFVLFDQNIHYAENYINLLRTIFEEEFTSSPLRFFPTDDDINKADTLFSQIKNERSRGIVVFVPDNLDPEKSWGINNYSRLSESLTQIGFSCVIVGNENNKAGGDRIKSAYNFCGQTTLGMVQHIFSKSKAIVSDYTDLMHLATTMQGENKPLLVALFGQTDTVLYSPYKYENSVIITRENKNVKDIIVDEVFELIMRQK